MMKGEGEGVEVDLCLKNPLFWRQTLNLPVSHAAYMVKKLVRKDILIVEILICRKLLSWQ